MLLPICLTQVASVLFVWFIAAIEFAVIIIIGYVVSLILTALVRRISATLEVEERIHTAGLSNALLGFTLTDIIELIVKIYVVLLSLSVASSVIDLTPLEFWAFSAIGYMESAIQGIVVLVVGLFLGDFISDKIKKSTILGANFVGIVVEVFIVFNAVVLALPALMPSLDTELLKTSFVLIIGAFAVALSLGAGLSIGLGMKDVVASLGKKHEKAIEASLFSATKKE